MADGASAEIAVVGNEGIIGIALFMGGETMPNRAVVQSAGSAYRLKGQLLKEEFNRAGQLQHLLLRYTQALLTQMSQTAVCNRHHSVDQQLCRWLLLSLDRLPSNELTMTQELIANMLGVRREGVTEAAGKLQSALMRVLPGGEDGIRSPAALRDRQVTGRGIPHRLSSQARCLRGRANALCALARRRAQPVCCTLNPVEATESVPM
jgi:CRP-like cAMP-binding protein